MTWKTMACQVYSELFSDCTPERMDQLFRYLDKDNTGYIDFLSWSRRIRLQVCAHHCANADFFAAGWPPDVYALCCRDEKQLSNQWRRCLAPMHHSQHIGMGLP